MATFPQIYASFTKIISVVKSMVEWVRMVTRACWLVTRNYLQWKGHTHPQGLRYKTLITHLTTVQHVSSFQYLLIPFYHNILKQLLLSQNQKGRCNKCQDMKCMKDEGIHKDNLNCAKSLGCGCNGISGNGLNSCDKMVPKYKNYGKSQICCGGSFNLYWGNYENEISRRNLSLMIGGDLEMSKGIYSMEIDYSDDLQKWNKGARKKTHLEIHQNALLSLKPRISISEGDDENENNDDNTVIKNIKNNINNDDDDTYCDQIDGCEDDKITSVLQGRCVGGDFEFLNNLKTCFKVENPLPQNENDLDLSLKVLSNEAGGTIFSELCFKAPKNHFEEASNAETDPYDSEEIFECDNVYEDYEDNEIFECDNVYEDYEDGNGMDGNEDEGGWESEDCHPYEEYNEDDDELGVVFDLDEYDKNLSRNIQDDDDASDSIVFTTEDDLIKRVRFSQKIDYIYHLGDWTVEEETSSRKGVWEEMVRDRNRFERRVKDVDKAIAYVLQPLHRETVFERLYGTESQFSKTFDDVRFFNLESKVDSNGNEKVNLICDVSDMNGVYIGALGNVSMNYLVDFEYNGCYSNSGCRFQHASNTQKDL